MEHLVSEGENGFNSIVKKLFLIIFPVLVAGSQKIIELIDRSEDLKASIQSRAERLADGIVPFSFLGFGLKKSAIAVMCGVLLAGVIMMAASALGVALL